MTHREGTAAAALHDLLVGGPRSIAALVDPMVSFIAPERALRCIHYRPGNPKEFQGLVWKGRVAVLKRMARSLRGFVLEGEGALATMRLADDQKSFGCFKKPRDPYPGEVIPPWVKKCQVCGRLLLDCYRSRVNCSHECKVKASHKGWTKRQRDERLIEKLAQGEKSGSVVEKKSPTTEHAPVKQPRNSAEIRCCRNCGKPLPQLSRKRTHCDDKCRIAYSRQRVKERNEMARAAREAQRG